MKIIKIYELLRCDFKTLMTIVPCSPNNNHIQTEHGWQLEGNKNFYFFLFFFWKPDVTTRI